MEFYLVTYRRFGESASSFVSAHHSWAGALRRVTKHIGGEPSQNMIPLDQLDDYAERLERGFSFSNGSEGAYTVTRLTPED